MIDRIYSMELETSTQLYPGQNLKQETVCSLMLEALKEKNAVLCQNGSSDARVFFRNGSAAYLDMTRYLEWCLPECKSVHEVVACDRAAGYILEDASRGVEKVLQERYPGIRCLIYKNNVSLAKDSASQVTYGTHENYSILEKPVKEYVQYYYSVLEKLVKQYVCDTVVNTYNGVVGANIMLIPFLVSRQILCGAGSIVLDPEIHYEISQRAQFIHSDISSRTTYARGIINTRDEPHAKNFYRVHITCGDATMLEHATLLKLGTTGLMLRMIEEQCMHPEFLIVEKPQTVLRSISRDKEVREKYKVLHQGVEKYFSAIDMQQCFLDAVVAFIAKQRCDGETELVLHHWQEVLDALRCDPTQLFGKVDWITKRMIIDKIKRKGSDASEGINLMYHLLDRTRGVFYKLEANHPEWRITSEEQVQQYRKNPPQTRAAARTRVVDTLREQGKTVGAVSWRYIYDDTNNIIRILDNPFSN